MNLSLSLTDNLGISRSSGVVDNGVEISDFANTTVTATQGDGYNIKKTGGTGGAYDASAYSVDAIVASDLVLKVRHISGTIFAGVSKTSGVDSNFTFAGPKVIMTGTQIQAYSFGASSGSLVNTTNDFAWVVYELATDTFRFYHNSADDLGTATLFNTIAGYAQGSTWYFDSSLNTANAEFTAKLT